MNSLSLSAILIYGPYIKTTINQFSYFYTLEYKDILENLILIYGLSIIIRFCIGKIKTIIKIQLDILFDTKIWIWKFQIFKAIFVLLDKFHTFS